MKILTCKSGRIILNFVANALLTKTIVLWKPNVFFSFRENLNIFSVFYGRVCGKTKCGVSLLYFTRAQLRQKEGRSGTSLTYSCLNYHDLS